MKQGSLSIIYSILDFDSQEVTTHLFSHASHLLLDAAHIEKIRISNYHISPVVLLQCEVILFFLKLNVRHLVTITMKISVFHYSHSEQKEILTIAAPMPNTLHFSSPLKPDFSKCI